MLLEISDPSTVDSLRLHLQANGCPSERRGDDVLEVRALWDPAGPLTEDQVRAKVVGHLREWCAANPGVKANLLS